MNCKNCGFPLNGEQKCPSCGTPVNSIDNNMINNGQVTMPTNPVEPVNNQTVPVTEPVNQQPIPAVGQEVQNNMPVEPVIPTQNVVPTMPVSEGQPQINQQPMQNPNLGDIPVMPAASDPNISSIDSSKKKNTGVIIFFIITVVLIIGAGIYFGIKFFGGDKGETNTTEETVEVEEAETEVVADESSVYITLDGMSYDALVDNVKKISNISSTDLAGKFTDRFILSDNDHYLEETKNTFGDNPQYLFSSDAEIAYISAVYAKNLSEAEDGTISINEKSYIDTYMIVTDEGTAREIYNNFKNLLSTMGTLTSENQAETTISADYDINGLHYMVGFASYSNDYQVHVQIPVK